MSETATENAPLTVVLVHGAFADASSWNGVIERPGGRRNPSDGARDSAARHRS